MVATAVRLATVLGLGAIAGATPALADMTSNTPCWIELSNNSTYNLAPLCGDAAISGGDVYGADTFNPDIFLAQYQTLIQGSRQYGQIIALVEDGSWLPVEDGGLYCFAKAFGTSRGEFLQATRGYAENDLNLPTEEVVAWTDHWLAISTAADQHLCPGSAL